jgi:hypothetical protein
MRLAPSLACLLLGAIQPAWCEGPFGFSTVPPCRVVDTRNTGGSLAGGATRAFAVNSGNCSGVVPSDAKAVYLNVTAIDPTHAGHLRLYSPALGSPPNTAALNFSAGPGATGNGVLVNVSPAGQVTVFSGVQSPGTVHLTLDVLGFYRSAEPLRFFGLPTCRLLDTREAAGDGGGLSSLIRKCVPSRFRIAVAYPRAPAPPQSP